MDNDDKLIASYKYRIDRVKNGKPWQEEAAGLSTGQYLTLALALNKLTRKNLGDRTPSEAWNRLDPEYQAVVQHFNPLLVV